MKSATHSMELLQFAQLIQRHVIIFIMLASQSCIPDRRQLHMRARALVGLSIQAQLALKRLWPAAKKRSEPNMSQQVQRGWTLRHMPQVCILKYVTKKYGATRNPPQAWRGSTLGHMGHSVEGPNLQHIRA